jgi:hypothetical protein
LEEVTRGEEVDAFEAGDGAGHGGEGEDLIDATAVGLGGDVAGGEEAFYFGSEEEPVALSKRSRARVIWWRGWS